MACTYVKLEERCALLLGSYTLCVGYIATIPLSVRRFAMHIFTGGSDLRNITSACGDRGPGLIQCSWDHSSRIRILRIIRILQHLRIFTNYQKTEQILFLHF